MDNLLIMSSKSLCYDCPIPICKVKSRGIVEFCSARRNFERGKRKNGSASSKY